MLRGLLRIYPARFARAFLDLLQPMQREERYAPFHETLLRTFFHLVFGVLVLRS